MCMYKYYMYEEACLEPQHATFLCQQAFPQAGLTHGDQMWPSEKICSFLCSLFFPLLLKYSMRHMGQPSI